MYRAVSSAAARPRRRATTWSAPSIPAETPAVVTIFPLSTKGRPSWTDPFGNEALRRGAGAARRGGAGVGGGAAAKWVVAVFPSRTPSEPRTKAPLQTERAISEESTADFAHAI